MILEIKVTPQSRENKIIEFKHGILKIKIKGTPVKGKVNENLIRFLANLLNISQQQVTIISGFTSQRKRVQIVGAEEDVLRVVAQISTP